MKGVKLCRAWCPDAHPVLIVAGCEGAEHAQRHLQLLCSFCWLNPQQLWPCNNLIIWIPKPILSPCSLHPNKWNLACVRGVGIWQQTWGESAQMRDEVIHNEAQQRHHASRRVVEAAVLPYQQQHMEQRLHAVPHHPQNATVSCQALETSASNTSSDTRGPTGVITVKLSERVETSSVSVKCCSGLRKGAKNFALSAASTLAVSTSCISLPQQQCQPQLRTSFPINSMLYATPDNISPFCKAGS